MKRILGFVLALTMLLSLCAGTASADERRTITVGVWFDQYYDSTHESLEDNPGYAGDELDVIRFENVKRIEDTFNVNIECVNLTYSGVVDSINTSILAGAPDCDVYMCSLSLGVPAAFNGYVQDLREILPADSDIFTTKTVMKGVSFGSSDAVYLMKPVGAMEGTYPMMYNRQLVEEAGLEDPYELWERGEWTWDKFLEYAIATTKDLDGDGVTDQWGFDAFVEESMSGFLMSNGANIAATPEEKFSSPEVGEVLQLLQDMEVVYKCAMPIGDGSVDAHRGSWRNGNIAFSIGAAWIMGDAYNGENPVEFDFVYIPFPVGPHGNKDTNAMMEAGGNFFFIPVGVEDPKLVYDVFYEWCNWYQGDVSLRDDPESLAWWSEATAKIPELQEHNLAVQQLCQSREYFDLWKSVGFYPDWQSLYTGAVTVSQFQETYKLQYQDALDAYFN